MASLSFSQNPSSPASSKIKMPGGPDPKIILRWVGCLGIILAMSLTTMAAAQSPGDQGRINPKMNPADLSSYEKIPLGRLWQNPSEYVGRKIKVEGLYRGWQGQVENPLITRSDWAVEDNSGTIYVTGLPANRLDPRSDLGRSVTIWGTVKVNPKKVPYIAADKVMVQQDN